MRLELQLVLQNVAGCALSRRGPRRPTLSKPKQRRRKRVLHLSGHRLPRTGAGFRTQLRILRSSKRATAGHVALDASIIQPIDAIGEQCCVQGRIPILACRACAEVLEQRANCRKMLLGSGGRR